MKQRLKFYLILVALPCLLFLHGFLEYRTARHISETPEYRELGAEFVRQHPGLIQRIGPVSEVTARPSLSGVVLEAAGFGTRQRRRFVWIQFEALGSRGTESLTLRYRRGADQASDWRFHDCAHPSREYCGWKRVQDTGLHSKSFFNADSTWRLVFARDLSFPAAKGAPSSGFFLAGPTHEDYARVIPVLGESFQTPHVHFYVGDGFLGNHFRLSDEQWTSIASAKQLRIETPSGAGVTLDQEALAALRDFHRVDQSGWYEQSALPSTLAPGAPW